MELANERAQATLAIAEGHGFQIWESLATILLGAAQMTLGGPEEGLAKVERGFVLYQGHKTPPVFYPHLIGMRALAYAQSGRPAEGLELLDGLIEEMGEKRFTRELPPVLLLKGELLLALSPENTAQARGHLQGGSGRRQACGRQDCHPPPPRPVCTASCRQGVRGKRPDPG